MQSDSVRDEAAIDYELDVLAESHGVGFWFGEVGPQLREAGLITLFENDRIVVRLRHLNLYNSKK